MAIYPAMYGNFCLIVTVCFFSLRDLHLDLIFDIPPDERVCGIFGEMGGRRIKARERGNASVKSRITTDTSSRVLSTTTITITTTTTTKFSLRL